MNYFPVNLVVTKGSRSTTLQREKFKSGRCDVSSCLSTRAGRPAVALSDLAFWGCGGGLGAASPLHW